MQRQIPPYRRTAITDSDVAAAVEISTATTNRLQPPVVMSAQVELNPSADDTIIAAMNTTDMEYTSSEYVWRKPRNYFENYFV